MKKTIGKKEQTGEYAPAERRNMCCGILHGMFFHMGTAFADPYAVVPLFLAGFTESRVFIGFVVSLIQALDLVPQLGVSRLIRRHPRSARPIMLAGIWTRCGVWGLIALTILWAPDQTDWILTVFIFLVALYSLGAGFAVLPFRRIISQTISPSRRSTFFGGRLIGGGILSVLAGVMVKAILESEKLSWPCNYGVLFALSFASLTIAYSAMSGLRVSTPVSRLPEPVLPPLRQEIKQAWKTYPVIRRLIGVRLLSGGLPLVLPFLTLYAINDLEIRLAWVGVFIAAQKIGSILSNFGWMPLGNRLGTRGVVRSGLGVGVLALALVAGSHSPFALTLAFALSGGAKSGLAVGFSGYLLEIGTPEIRPLLFALEGTLLMPLYFMPLLGGWLADWLGYRPLVWMGGGLLLAAIALARTLCEPRSGDPGCGPYRPAGQRETSKDRKGGR